MQKEHAENHQRMGPPIGFQGGAHDGRGHQQAVRRQILTTLRIGEHLLPAEGGRIDCSCATAK